MGDQQALRHQEWLRLVVQLLPGSNQQAFSLLIPAYWYDSLDDKYFQLSDLLFPATAQRPFGLPPQKRSLPLPMEFSTYQKACFSMPLTLAGKALLFLRSTYREK